jgi:CBS domain-containing protein
MMNVSDVMTHGVVTIGPDASVRDAIACMAHSDVSGLPVVDAAGTLVGMLTEGDLLRRVEMATEAARPRWLERLFAAGADDYARSHGHRVADVMTDTVVTVGADASLGEVVRLMEAHAIRRLPVVAGDRVVGIVSRADLVAALAACLAEGLPPTRA